MLLDKLLPTRLKEIIAQYELAEKVAEIPNHVDVSNVPLQGEQIVLQFIMIRYYYNYLKDLHKRKPELVTDDELLLVYQNLKVIRDELKARWKILKELANHGFSQMLEISQREGGLKREE
jgi:hypothetical protein